MSFRLLLPFLLIAWTSAAVALDATDQGLYNVIHRDGHTTDTTFMAAIVQDRWHLYRQMPNRAWEDVTCEGDCALVESSMFDLTRFFLADDLKQISPTCIHNKAFAFCRYASVVLHSVWNLIGYWLGSPFARCLGRSSSR